MKQRYPISISFSFLSLSLLACSGGNREGAEQEDGVLPPPLFTYVPGPEGRAVGVHGVIEIDGKVLTTNTIEMQLVAQPDEAPTKEELLEDELPTNKPAAWAPPYRDLSASVGTGADKAALSARTQSQISAPCHTVGDVVSEIYTVNGAVSYTSFTYSAGLLYKERSLSITSIYGRDGIYTMVSDSRNSYFPADFVHSTMFTGIGVIFGDGSGSLSTDYVEGLTPLSVSFSLFSFALGYSVFIRPGGGAFARAIQYDAGMSIGGGLLPTVSPLSMSVQETSTLLAPIRFTRSWGNDCSQPQPGEELMAYIRNNLRRLAQAGELPSLRANLTREFAVATLPLYESLSAQGVGAPGEYVPAGSNADMFSDFLSTNTDQVRGDGENTSIDGQISSYDQDVSTIVESEAALYAAVTAHRDEVERSVPSLVGLGALLREAEGGMSAAVELLGTVDEDENNDEHFVAPGIKHIEVEPGETAEIVITAKEIADLVGSQPHQVQGATIGVTIDATAAPTEFVLEGDQLRLVFDLKKDSVLALIVVNLGTAVGPFPVGADAWVVRPMMRAVKMKAGPPSTAFLAGPARLPSGAPVSLNVQLYDEQGRLVKQDYEVRFVDEMGVEVGRVDQKQGTTLFQYVPTPSVPVVVAVAQVGLTHQDVEQPGIQISGTGFSKEAAVTLNGTPVAAEMVRVDSAEVIFVVVPEGISQEGGNIVVTNPGGQTSGAFTLEN